ncbi:SUMF1/EgtB/PvdO family nonheme iron enzyme [Thiotrichales bacterium HSG1]|nr:SUMF1/EgtB/PvdO family nonheme iron enzyme [Thiotrichales bacterium HSG1]
MWRFLVILIVSMPVYADRLALVIGNGDYLHESSLNSPVNDAKDMAKVLRGLGFTVIDEYNLRLRNFDSAVQEFEDKLKNYDVGLFYYSGHGLQAEGDNYLVPVDARIQSSVDIRYVSVNANRILEKMEYANKHVNLLILDACRDNPFKGITKGSNRGLAEMSPRGSLIAFATAPKTTALDGLPSERNSVYTKHLLKQLRTQPHLSVSDLLTQVAGGVAKETNQKQWPWKSDSLTSTFYFQEESRSPNFNLANSQDKSWTPGEVFQDRLKDGSLGPEMVIIPNGRFQMGSNDYKSEQPVHWVNIDYQFAMGKYEVTVGEFRKFVNSTGYETEAEKQGECHSMHGESSERNWHTPKFPQKDNQPVVCISWNDANAYTKWLSQQTGKEYRLPSEAEWEYAARAGTETKYWWGNDIGKNKANCDGCGSQWDNKQTAPVGSFIANQFGLYDTVGNVWEWCADGYQNNYNNAPNDGRVWKNNNKYKMLRGGSWSYPTNYVRATLRFRYYDYVTPTGFRVVGVIVQTF